MAGRKSDFTLTRLDDLFSTQEQRDEEKLSKIRDIPLELIDDFPDHPFKVRDDEDRLTNTEKLPSSIRLSLFFLLTRMSYRRKTTEKPLTNFCPMRTLK